MKSATEAVESLKKGFRITDRWKKQFEFARPQIEKDLRKFES